MLPGDSHSFSSSNRPNWKTQQVNHSNVCKLGKKGSWFSAIKRVFARSSKEKVTDMTVNTLSESADECFANGMDSFVSKPVTFQKLKECLQQYLS